MPRLAQETHILALALLPPPEEFGFRTTHNSSHGFDTASLVASHGSPLKDTICFLGGVGEGLIWLRVIAVLLFIKKSLIRIRFHEKYLVSKLFI